MFERSPECGGEFESPTIATSVARAKKPPTAQRMTFRPLDRSGCTLDGPGGEVDGGLATLETCELPQNLQNLESSAIDWPH